jgi:hypothetical protein
VEIKIIINIYFFYFLFNFFDEKLKIKLSYFPIKLLFNINYIIYNYNFRQ